MVIKDYVIPADRKREETRFSWTNKTHGAEFVFNFRDTDHAVYHIVYGEALLERPEIVREIVVAGCSQHVPDDQEGKPYLIFSTDVPDFCDRPLGGLTWSMNASNPHILWWLPGMVLWDMPTHAGIPVGVGVGIVGIRLRVFFKDAQPGTVVRDGIRVFYTPTTREQTMDVTPVLWAGMPYGVGNHDNPTMWIPPGVRRWFVTRTCEVVDGCRDASEEELQRQDWLMLLGRKYAVGTCDKMRAAGWCTKPGIDAAMLAAHGLHTSFDSPVRLQMRFLCPASCGSGCPALGGADELPVVSAWLRTLSLGSEVHATLTRGGAAETMWSTGSWNHSDRAVVPLLGRHLTIRAGDVLQTTCVFDSTSRERRTRFGLEADDEVCKVGLATTRPAASEAQHPPFRCDGSVWAGALAPGEDALQIATNHPHHRADRVWRMETLSPGTPSNPIRYTRAECPEGTEARPEACREWDPLTYSWKVDHDCCGHKCEGNDVFAVGLDEPKDPCSVNPFTGMVYYTYACCSRSKSEL